MFFNTQLRLPGDTVVDSVVSIVVKRVGSDSVGNLYSGFLFVIEMIDVAINASIINRPRQITMIRSFRLFDLQ